MKTAEEWVRELVGEISEESKVNPEWVEGLVFGLRSFLSHCYTGTKSGAQTFLRSEYSNYMKGGSRQVLDWLISPRGTLNRLRYLRWYWALLLPCLEGEEHVNVIFEIYKAVDEIDPNTVRMNMFDRPGMPQFPDIKLDRQTLGRAATRVLQKKADQKIEV